MLLGHGTRFQRQLAASLIVLVVLVTLTALALVVNLPDFGSDFQRLRGSRRGFAGRFEQRRANRSGTTRSSQWELYRGAPADPGTQAPQVVFDLADLDEAATMAAERVRVPAARAGTLEVYSLSNVPHMNESVAAGRLRMAAVAKQPGRLFISVSSYRDENCIPTLKQIFEKCIHCDRITVGLVDQVAAEDTPCMPPKEFEAQTKIVRLSSAEARGPTLARYLASRLWSGEEHFMQIDAHLHFVDAWDTKLFDMIQYMPTSRYVITHYPVATVGELENVGYSVPFVCAAKFEEYMLGLFSQDSGWYDKNQFDGAVQAAPFLAAGFLFGPATMLIDVPFDRYLDFLFHGEEFIQAARLWTNGYELIVPRDNICSHVYGNRKFNAFAEHPASGPLAEQARLRVRYLLGMTSELPSRTEELTDLGLGNVRTLKAYLDYTGVDLAAGTINDRCLQRFDWETRSWYAIGEPKPVFKRLINFVDAKSFPESEESVQTYLARIKSNSSRKQGTIFVSVGAYRDKLCQSTIVELFEKCKLCDRVFVAIIDQTLPGSNDQPCVGPSDRLSQTSVIRMNSKQSQGPTMARYLASKLYDNEEFYLQIDSHLHFVDDWDVVLDDMLHQMPTQKAVISNYAVVDSTPLNDSSMWVPWICDATFNVPAGLIVQRAMSWYNRFNEETIRSNAVPGSSPFIGAGFLYASAQLLFDIPFDRYIPYLFHGEELLLAARLWTNGWDFFIPLRNVVSHHYYGRDFSVYTDNKDAHSTKEASWARVRALLQLNDEIPSDAREMNVLGLGTVRPIAEYWKFAGLDMVNQVINNRCDQIFDYKAKKWLPRPPDP